MSVQISEKDFQKQVLDLARIFGWRAYHPFLSKWSERGFPDLTLVRPPRLVFAELKAEKGRVSEAQAEWVSLLRETPAEMYVWRPSDLETVAEVLR